MRELKILGEQNIGQMQFIGLEGGFGEGKKAMLVKDIAKIHDKEMKEITKSINRNRDRFKNSVDIIDLKAREFDYLGYTDVGYTKQSFNQSKNIYVLSERGYSKLLKILEDDKSWEMYDKLVDEYFTMRQNITAISTGLEPQILQLAQGMQMIGQVVQGMQTAMVNMQEYVKDSINSKDLQIEQTAEMIGLRSKNTMVLVDYLKYKLTQLSGRRIMGTDYLYGKTKNKVFREFKVYRWEDIAIKDFSRVHAYIDGLEKEDIGYLN